MLVPGAAVGAVGVPVKEGDAIVALNAMSAGKFEMVEELTPPTLLTVGKSAVPPRSLVNLILPFVEAVASGVAEALIPV